MAWWKMKKFKFFFYSISHLHPLKNIHSTDKTEIPSSKKTIISARLFAVCQQQQFYITLYVHSERSSAKTTACLPLPMALLRNYQRLSVQILLELEKTSANFKNHFFKLATPEVPQKSIRYLVYWKKKYFQICFCWKRVSFFLERDVWQTKLRNKLLVEI